MRSGTFREKARCDIHKQQCDFATDLMPSAADAPPRPFLLDVTGSMCTPFSFMGLRLMFCDEVPLRSFAVWLAEMILQMPDFIIHENTRGERSA